MHGFNARSRTTVRHLLDSCVAGTPPSQCTCYIPAPRKLGTPGPSTVFPGTATRPVSIKLPTCPTGCQLPAVLTRPQPKRQSPTQSPTVSALARAIRKDAESEKGAGSGT